MTFTVLMRRSSVPGHAPTTTQLNLGEMSVNTYDGIVYFMQSNGTSNSVIALSPIAATANALANTVTISLGGDASGSTSFNGSNNVTITTTLANVNTAIGNFGTTTVVPTITVNAKGLITAISNSSIAFPVTSVGGSTGAVTGGTFTTVTVFNGQVTTITAPAGDSTTNVATTAFVTHTVGNYLLLNGGTLNGNVTIANTAAAANGGSTTFHVDSVVNGVTDSRISLVSNPSGGSAINMFGMQPTGIQSFSNLNANSQLWNLSLNSGAMAGNNTGGNYMLTPYNDSGAVQTTAVTTYRSNGVTVFSNSIVTVTQPLTDNSTNVATTAWVNQTAVDTTGDTMTGVLNMPLGATTITQPTTDNTTNVATTAFVVNQGNSTYMPIAGGTFTGNVYTSNGVAMIINGALISLTSINSLGLVAATGGLFNLAPSANTINYTQVNVYDGNTGGYCINNAGGVNCWSIKTAPVTANAATNANTGADLTFTAWTGAGTPPATATNVLTLYRGNAVAAFSNTVTTITQPLTDATSNVATTAFVKSANATQIGRYVVGTIGALSGTYYYSLAVGTPTITGWGATLFTTSITPTSTSSKIRLEFNCYVASGGNRTVYFLITRGTTVIGLTATTVSTTSNPGQIDYFLFDSPNTTASTTYTVYYACASSTSTVYINQSTSGSTGGGSLSSNYYLQDI